MLELKLIHISKMFPDNQIQTYEVVSLLNGF